MNIPHTGQWRWIDRVIEVDRQCITVEAEVRSEHLFLRQGFLPSYTGIEYMAQAVAAWAAEHSQHKDPVIGYLVGTRRYELLDLEPIAEGSILQICAKLEFEDGHGMYMFGCYLMRDQKMCARSNVMVYQEPKNEF